MLFERRLRDGLVDGSITVAFRRWRRAQVVAGHRYRTGAGGPLVEAERVDVVKPDALTRADARRAGFASPQELLAGIRGEPDWPLYRIRFRVIDAPDPRDLLASQEVLDDEQVTELHARLARLDRAAGEGGAWTRATLELIAAQPAVLAGDLAAELGLERLLFKRRVRSLKAIGLTISLPVGYRLSPRGQAYLTRVRSARG